ncbi:MAG: glycosyltransferase [Candidatus Limnocylindrales bacterium]
MTDRPEASPGRLGLGGPAAVPQPPGLRVVLDIRPAQEPGRAPATAAYLTELLAAYAADPAEGESFVLLLQAGGEDPTAAPEFDRLDVVGRRLLPPTRLLRSGAMTIDPFLLRGVSLGAAWHAERGGAHGAVYHTAAGAAPLASGLPVVVSVLDLAPWELPGTYQAGTIASFGRRLRVRILRDAAAVIVGSEASGRAARRLLHLRRDRIHVVPLAARAAFSPAAAAGTADEVARLGLPGRYLVYPGRYDARQDLVTLLRALSTLAAGPSPAAGRRRSSRARPDDVPWPPRILLVGASPEDRAALARAAAREGVGELISYAPSLPPERLAAVVAGARAVVLPVLSEAAGTAAIEAFACGTPVVASAVGALPELVAGAGILVEPRDPDRLAAAISTAWADDAVHDRIAADSRARAAGPRRTWADVARETRAVYAAVGLAAGRGDGPDRAGREDGSDRPDLSDRPDRTDR